MTSKLHTLAAAFVKPRPEIRPGYTVRVHERIQEGGKERIQVFEGLVISVHKGLCPTDSTFTVRRIASGVGVERNFPLHSPKLEKVEVKKVAKIRRAKLFFLRGRKGKAARLSERFTTSEEFAVAAMVPDEEPEEEMMTEEPPVEDAEELKDADATEEVQDEMKSEEESAEKEEKTEEK